MAETPASPEHDPTTGVPATQASSEAAPGDVAAGEGPTDLEAVLAAALDEDDLPEPHPSVAPTPTLEAATARPTVGSHDPSPSAAEPQAVAAAAPKEADTRGVPTVGTTLEVAPLADAPAGGAEGGEWEVLIGKLKAWLAEADLPGQWDRLGGPLRGFGLLLAALLVIKLYVALLDTLDDLPLLPRILQLVGLIALINFSLNRLTRKSDREVILADWKRRWDAFRGS